MADNPLSCPLKRWGTWGSAADLLLLAAVWILSVILVNPRGDFPLGDDWSYSLAVRRLLNEGGFFPTGWTQMTLITQVLWGALFCKIWGFSHFVLRASTLLLGGVGVFCAYFLLRLVKASRFASVLAALVLAANPMYFLLSNTFMTDVPFTVLFTLTALLFIQALRVESRTPLVLATALLLPTILLRQLGLVLPMAFVPAYLKKRGVSLPSVVWAGLPLVAGVGSLTGFQAYLRATSRIPKLYEACNQKFIEAISGDPVHLFRLVGGTTFVIVLYVGLFLLPFLVMVLPAWWKAVTRKTAVFGVALFGVFVLVAAYRTLWAGHLMPLSYNTLWTGGVGRFTLYDTCHVQAHHEPAFPHGVWAAVTGISILGGGLFVVYALFALMGVFARYRNARLDAPEAIVLFLFLVFPMYCLPGVAIGFYDRFLIPLIPLICVAVSVPVLAHMPSGRLSGLNVSALVMIFLGLAFSVASAHDWLAGNRTRWRALHALMDHDHIPPAEIDGGLEFNGWYLYDPNYTPSPRKSWWWVHKDTYALTLGTLDGFEVVREYPYRRWVPPFKATFYVLRRAPARPGDAPE